jgi:hypothetical protein
MCLRGSPIEAVKTRANPRMFDRIVRQIVNVFPGRCVEIRREVRSGEGHSKCPSTAAITGGDGRDATDGAFESGSSFPDRVAISVCGLATPIFRIVRLVERFADLYAGFNSTHHHHPQRTVTRDPGNTGWINPL